MRSGGNNRHRQRHGAVAAAAAAAAAIDIDIDTEQKQQQQQRWLGGMEWRGLLDTAHADPWYTKTKTRDVIEERGKEIYTRT